MASEHHPSLPKWESLEEENVYHTRIFDLVKAIRREDETGREGEFYSLHAGEWINVIAITVDAQLVFVEQFRHGTDMFELELVGGIVDAGESPHDASLRELLEETGYAPTETSIIEEIGVVRPNPAFLNNNCYTYLVTDVALTNTQHFDEFENIAVRLEPLSEMDNLVRNGTITHSLVLAAFYWYHLWSKQF